MIADTDQNRPGSDTRPDGNGAQIDADSDRGYESERDARLERPDLFVQTEAEARAVIEALGAWIENRPAVDISGEPVEEHLREGHRVLAWWAKDYKHDTRLRADGVVEVLTSTAQMGESASETEWWCSTCGGVQVPGPVEEDYT